MLRAMSTAASGMQAQQMRMDSTANNLANVNTTGYKKSRVQFQDLFYEQMRTPGAPTSNENQAPTGLEVGRGTRAVGTVRDFRTGDLTQTGGRLDVAIEGPGFFQVRTPNGEIAYTRDGSFRTSARGQLVTADGYALEPGLAIPEDTQEVTVSADGIVSVLPADSTQSVEVGRIQLASFVNPGGLRPEGQNLYSETEASGMPLIAEPGARGTGTLAQGFLEGSNVRVVEEMIDLISTQRAYETNSKVVRAADEMLRSTSNLR